jgi:ABC-type transport system involved in cytochrome bd biosynthesis fused ATPase/permease subunit
VKFPKGKLCAIIGSTGAGKTSLLLTLLGEMKRIEGKYSIPEHHLANPYKFERSDIAYVSQNAWLMNATIRDTVNEIFRAQYCNIEQIDSENGYESEDSETVQKPFVINTHNELQAYCQNVILIT